MSPTPSVVIVRLAESMASAPARAVGCGQWESQFAGPARAARARLKADLMTPLTDDALSALEGIAASHNPALRGLGLDMLAAAVSGSAPRIQQVICPPLDSSEPGCVSVQHA
jgi:hypothetical protein